MIGQLTTEQVAFFAILIGGFVLLLTEWLRTDVVAVLIILSLYLSGVLSAEQALSGFGGEAAIVVAAVFVLSGGMHQTGLSETIGLWIGRMAGRSFSRIIGVVMPSVAVLSAFTHHLTTTAIMLPVTLNLARDRDIAPSRLLMPLSFAASLGTTITIIAAPAFLIASGVLKRAGRDGLGIFSIAPIGLVLLLVGTLFVLLVGRVLLPSRGGAAQPAGMLQLDEFFTEIAVLADSPFVGRTVAEVETARGYGMRVMGWIRGGRTIGRERSGEIIRSGDVLLVRVDPDQLVTIQHDPGVELQPLRKYAGTMREAEDGGDPALVQVVVAPTAELKGKTLGQVDFRRRYGVIVVGLWRRDGWLQEELSQIRLRGGDVLLLQGQDTALAQVVADPAFLMMVPFHGEPRPRRKAILAGVIMTATVVAAASRLVSIDMASLAGAVAMVLLGCITVNQAYRAIDTRIYVFIAGALPLGTAMEQTGSSRLLAEWLGGVVTGWEPFVVLAILFALVGVLTQFMSDAATTALFAPVAVALARALGHAPEAYVVTVAMAAVASFLTPIGHHGNLLVYGPGNYRFMDFVRVGTPLTLLMGTVVVIMAPLLWPL